MPLKTIDKGNFIYIAYRREGFQDFDQFRKIIQEFSSNNGVPRDIIVDLTKSEALTEAETSILVNVMRDFQMTTRHLRIVGTGMVIQKLMQINLGKSGNVKLYTDHTVLMADLNAPSADNQ